MKRALFRFIIVTLLTLLASAVFAQSGPVGPYAVSVYVGAYSSGGPSSLARSDSSYYVVNSTNVSGLGQAAGAQCDINVSSMPFDHSVGGGLRVEATAPINATMMVWVYNWSTGLFDYKGAIPATGSSAAQIITLSASDLSNYLNAANQARIVTRAHVPSRFTPVPFSYKIDLVQFDSLPGAPTSLSTATESNTEISLTWTDNSSNESSFRIERRLTSSTSWSTVTDTSANTTTYTDTGLSSATSYTYRVRAVSSVGTSGTTSESASTTFPAGTLPYLRAVDVNTDCFLAAGTTQGTVKLAMKTPVAVLVSLRSTNPLVSVPVTVSVPAGSRQATFTVTVASPAGISEGEIYASLGKWVQKKSIYSASSSALPITDASAATGAGGVWLQWMGLEKYIFGNTVVGYRVLRSVAGGPFIVLNAATPTTMGSFIDTAAPSGSLTYRIELVNVAGSVLATSPTATTVFNGSTPNITWTSVPSGTISGEVTLTATNPDLQQTGYLLYIDGSPCGSATANGEVGGSVSTVSTDLDTSILSNGDHQLMLASDMSDGSLYRSPIVTVHVSNAIGNLSCDGLFQVNDGGLPELTGKLAPGTAGYVITLSNESNAVIRTWNGAGSEVSVVWDGKDELGNSALDGNLTYKISLGDPTTDRYSSLTKVGQAPDFLVINTVTDRFYPGTATDYSAKLAGALTSLRSMNPGLTTAMITIGERTAVNKEYAKKLRMWLGSSVHYFYFFGHGLIPNPAAVNNHILWIGHKTKGVNLRNFTARNSDWHTITIPNITQPGQYKFVFLDCCGPVGRKRSGESEDTWSTHMTASPHLQWASAFNMNLSDGVFLGNNGEGFFGGPISFNKSWRDWRNFFWDAMVTGNKDVISCVSYADTQLGAALEPNQKSFSTIHNQRKLYFFGNFGPSFPH